MYVHYTLFFIYTISSLAPDIYIVVAWIGRVMLPFFDERISTIKHSITSTVL